MNKSLNCNPGNYQCGGICINNSRKCISEVDATGDSQAFSALVAKTVKEQLGAKSAKDGKVSSKQLAEWQANAQGQALLDKLNGHINWWANERGLNSALPAAEGQPVVQPIELEAQLTPERQSPPVNRAAMTPDELTGQAANWVRESLGDGLGVFAPFSHDLEHLSMHNITGVDSAEIQRTLAIANNNFVIEESLVQAFNFAIGEPLILPTARAKAKVEASLAMSEEEKYVALRDSITKWTSHYDGSKPGNASIKQAEVGKPEALAALAERMARAGSKADWKTQWFMNYGDEDGSRTYAIQKSFDKYV